VIVSVVVGNWLIVRCAVVCVVVIIVSDHGLIRGRRLRGRSCCWV
jgi:hypothetical protein